MDPLFELRLVVDHLFDTLPTAPYHEFLGVEANADGDTLRKAFHQRARQFHPDRYQRIDAELKTRIYEVYKRMAEAYQVLSNPESRAKYELQRARGANRYDPTEESSQPKKPKGEIEITNPKAKQYYKLALDAERRGDKKGQKMNLQFAIQMEPGNEELKQLMEKLK